jgi:hypothetical protein
MTVTLRAASLRREPTTRIPGTTTMNATMATVAAAEAFAERTDLRILASRATKSTPSVTDQTIAGRKGIARK